MPGNDAIDYEILDDGTIRSSTGRVSNANHANAEEFFLFVEKLTGGKVERNQKKGTHGHHHHHGHEHKHEEHNH